MAKKLKATLRVFVDLPLYFDQVMNTCQIICMFTSGPFYKISKHPSNICRYFQHTILRNTQLWRVFAPLEQHPEEVMYLHQERTSG